MNKDELVKIFENLKIPFNEGIQNDNDINKYPRIVFWEIGWDSNTASGVEYNTKVNYQVSFFSDIPRHAKLIELKKMLNDKKIFPYIEHEYIQTERYFHSFFSIEVLENV